MVESEKDVFDLTHKRQSNQLIGSIAENSGELLGRARASKSTSIREDLIPMQEMRYTVTIQCVVNSSTRIRKYMKGKRKGKKSTS